MNVKNLERHEYALRPGDLFRLDGDIILVRYAHWCSTEFQFHSVASQRSYSFTEGYILQNGEFLGNIKGMFEEDEINQEYKIGEK